MNIYPINNTRFGAALYICERADLVMPSDIILAELKKKFAEKTKNIPGDLFLATYEGLYKYPRLSYSTPQHYDFLEVKMGHFYDKENFLNDLENILNVFVKRKQIILNMMKTKNPEKRHEIAKETFSLRKEILPLNVINVIDASFCSRMWQLEQFLKE